MFSTDRRQLRLYFYQTWQKFLQKMPLSALETIIVELIQMHEEYRHLFEKEDSLDKDYLPETGQVNPFLHLSLHMALKEQLQVNRPQGITMIYQNLLQKYTKHEVEHKIMDCFAEMIWQAQKNQTNFDEKILMNCFKNIK